MKHITQIVVASIALVVAGCATGNLPQGARVVGGGLKISWSSPTPGTAILVEKTTGKTVTTKYLNGSTDDFDFNAANAHDADVLRSFLGTTVTNGQFVLYFVPDHE